MENITACLEQVNLFLWNGPLLFLLSAAHLFFSPEIYRKSHPPVPAPREKCLEEKKYRCARQPAIRCAHRARAWQLCHSCHHPCRHPGHRQYCGCFHRYRPRWPRRPVLVLLNRAFRHGNCLLRMLSKLPVPQKRCIRQTLRRSHVCDGIRLT